METEVRHETLSVCAEGVRRLKKLSIQNFMCEQTYAVTDCSGGDCDGSRLGIALEILNDRISAKPDPTFSVADRAVAVFCGC